MLTLYPVCLGSVLTLCLLCSQEEVSLAKEEWELSRLKVMKQEEERRAEIEEDEMLFTYSRDDAYSQVKKPGRDKKCGRSRKARSSGPPVDTSSTPSVTTSPGTPSDEPPKQGRRGPTNSKSSPTGTTATEVVTVAQKRVSKSDSHVSNHVAPPVVKKVAKAGVSPRGRGRPPGPAKVAAAAAAAASLVAASQPQPPPPVTTTQCIFVTYSAAGGTTGVRGPLQVAVPQRLPSMQQPVLASPARVRLQTCMATPRHVTSIAARPPRLVVPTSVVQSPRHVVASVGNPVRHVVISSVGTPLRQVATVSVATPTRQLITASVGMPIRQVTPVSVGTPPRQLATATVGTPPRQVAVVVQPWSNPNLVIRTRRAAGQLGPKNVIHVRQQQPLTKVSVMSQFATTGTRTVLLSLPNSSVPVVNTLATARLVTSNGPTQVQSRVLGPNIVYRHHVPSNTVPILEKMALQLHQDGTASTAGATSLLQAAPVGFNLFSRISAAAAAQQPILLQPQLIAVPATSQTRAPVAHADTNGTIGKDPV